MAAGGDRGLARRSPGASGRKLNHPRRERGPWQGRCPLCGREGQNLYQDHCHETNLCRDLLCTRCNTGLGQFGDDARRLRAAVRYLERWARAHREEPQRFALYREPPAPEAEERIEASRKGRERQMQEEEARWQREREAQAVREQRERAAAVARCKAAGVREVMRAWTKVEGKTAMDRLRRAAQHFEEMAEEALAGKP